MQALRQSQGTEWCICPHQALTGVNIPFLKSMLHLDTGFIFCSSIDEIMG